MNRKTQTFVNSLVLISLALGTISEVQAKRFGGGNSFGSKSTYSAPMKRADLPPSSNRVTTPPANRPAPSAPLPNYQRPQPQSNSQAWKDRAMGAAAGLAVGGLVGSMMSGNEQHTPAPQPAQPQNYAPAPQQGYAQQQAPQYVEQPQQNYTQPVPVQPAPQYAPAPMMAQPQPGYAQPMPYTDNTGATKSSGGFSFFNFLLLAGLGYLAYRFFFAKKNQTPAQAMPNYQRTATEPAYSSPTPTGGSSADFNTDIMFKKGAPTVSSSRVNLAKARDVQTPAGFDLELFLSDVKNRYTNLQQAWDERDFSQIRVLTTDKVFAEIQEQLKNSSESNHTDVLDLNATLLEIRELNSEFETTVLFDSFIRENVSSPANQVSEVWYFVKAKSGFNTNWLLDGIQQVEG